MISHVYARIKAHALLEETAEVFDAKAVQAWIAKSIYDKEPWECFVTTSSGAGVIVQLNLKYKGISLIGARIGAKNWENLIVKLRREAKSLVEHAIARMRSAELSVVLYKELIAKAQHVQRKGSVL